MGFLWFNLFQVITFPCEMDHLELLNLISNAEIQFVFVLISLVNKMDRVEQLQKHITYTVRVKTAPSTFTKCT